MSIAKKMVHPELIGRQTDYSSFTVKNDVRTEIETPHTICTFCPAANWFEQGGLQCFCSTMKFRTWPAHETPITMCDAREAAVAKYHIEKDRL